MIRSDLFVPAACLGLALSGASAQDYEVTLDSQTSSTTIDAGGVIDASGSLIGDYDPDTNPDGTQTREGIFGGSGNQPIDTLTTLNTQTLLDTQPAGSFFISMDPAGGIAEIEGLTLDLLGDDTGATTLSVTIGFDTFRTINPGFLYLGGIPITIPLGEVARLSEATLSQSGPALITLTPAGDPGVYEIGGVVPASLDMTVLLAPPGAEPSETPIDALPVLLPISGQAEIVGPDFLQLNLSASPDPISSVIPIEGVDLPAIPFDLPTLGDETAGVLFTLSLQSITLDAAFSIDVNATGTAPACPADLTGDGELDFFDLSAFLDALTSGQPEADINMDGETDFFDVSAYLVLFQMGCP